MDSSRSPGTAAPLRRSSAARILTVAAWLLLLFAPAVWKRGSPSRLFALAETPLDRPSPAAALQWTFLSDAAARIPPTAGYTVVALDPDAELNLYMMSFGLFPRGVAYPTSYYGHPLDWGQRAEWILDYGCRFAGATDRSLVHRVRGGCIERRMSARP